MAMINTQFTVGFTEAKTQLSQLTERVNRTGQSVLVLKNNKPWVTISPAQYLESNTSKLGDAYGMLKAYANPRLIKDEANAWEVSVKEQHATS